MLWKKKQTLVTQRCRKIKCAVMRAQMTTNTESCFCIDLHQIWLRNADECFSAWWIKFHNGDEMQAIFLNRLA